MSDWDFARRVLVVAAVFALLLLVWRLSDVLLLAFGAILVAVVLRAASAPLSEHSPLSEGAALGVVVLLLLVLLGLAGWLFGHELRQQFGNLGDRLPDAWAAARERIAGLPMGERLLDNLRSSGVGDGNIMDNIAGLAGSVGTAVAELLLVLFGGVYLAAQPGTYRRGLVMLVPGHAQCEIDETLLLAGDALRLWLKGQLIAMLLVGTLTGLGLWALGIPSALALGVLAGLFEFVPLIGPIVAAIPGILVAMTVGPNTALWALGLYVAIQQIEGNAITPLVQRHVVWLPPAITLFAVIAAGLLFGILGMLLATPLAVVVFVAVKKLWVRDALNKDTEVPGEEASARGD